VKLSFAVNTVTHEVVAMEVSTDDVHDVKALPGLVEGAGRNVRVIYKLLYFVKSHRFDLGSHHRIVLSLPVLCLFLRSVV
jgi:hypothetical protein